MELADSSIKIRVHHNSMPLYAFSFYLRFIGAVFQHGQQKLE